MDELIPWLIRAAIGGAGTVGLFYLKKTHENSKLLATEAREHQATVAKEARDHRNSLDHAIKSAASQSELAVKRELEVLRNQIVYDKRIAVLEDVAKAVALPDSMPSRADAAAKIQALDLIRNSAKRIYIPPPIEEALSLQRYELLFLAGWTVDRDEIPTRFSVIKERLAWIEQQIDRLMRGMLVEDLPNNMGVDYTKLGTDVIAIMPPTEVLEQRLREALDAEESNNNPPSTGENF